MRFLKTISAVLLFSFILFMSSCFSAEVHAAHRLQDTGDKVVIVIDPGHGGDNLGTQAGGIWDEKYMNMVTAQALYDELSLYDNVEIYMTRTTDVDVSFPERAGIAKSVDADFLFSIHYNASEYHELFGSEVWVPLSAPFNNYGYQVGYELLTGMRQRDLYIRGIKTREGDRGDYYAIIRETVAQGIPAVIIEHCHVDQWRDSGYCDAEEDLIQFGKDDATAIAKYFGLKSSALNVDYSDYQLVNVDGGAPVASTLRDDTPPDICRIEFLEADYDRGLLSLNVFAADYDSNLLYYSYSIDGGQTYSERNIWPDSDVLAGKYADTFTLTIPIPSGVQPSVIVRAHNVFDPYTDSNRYDSPIAFIYDENALKESGESVAEDETGEEGGAEDGNASQGQPEDGMSFGSDAQPAAGSAVAGEKPVSYATFLKVCLVAVNFLLALFMVSQVIAYCIRRKRRAQRRKDERDSRNHPR